MVRGRKHENAGCRVYSFGLLESTWTVRRTKDEERPANDLPGAHCIVLFLAGMRGTHDWNVLS